MGLGSVVLSWSSGLSPSDCALARLSMLHAPAGLQVSDVETRTGHPALFHAPCRRKPGSLQALGTQSDLGSASLLGRRSTERAPRSGRGYWGSNPWISQPAFARASRASGGWVGSFAGRRTDSEQSNCAKAVTP